MAEIFDDPGSSAAVGPKAGLYKEFNMRLTFRTTVFCGDEKIGSFV